MKKNERAQARSRPPLRAPKRKGEWAEVMFIAKAMELGLTVCRPYGDSDPFDFLVSVGGPGAVRIQVKSAWSRRSRSYKFGAGRCSRPYRKNEVDFVVVFVVPEDVWYVIPRQELGNRSVATISPHVAHSRARLEKYREAWRLLRLVEHKENESGPDLLPLPALLDLCDLRPSF